jgi:hypothetical protein
MAATAGAQNVTEWSVEARTSLGFRVRDAAIQALLPMGWKSEPSAAPASRGANLTLTLMERLLVLDGDGHTRRTGTIRYLVLSAPVMNVKNGEIGQPGTMVVGGLSPEGAGAYDAFLTATEARIERSSSSQMEDAGVAQETWQLAAASGERVDMRLRFRRGTPVKSHVDAVIRSAVHPAFTRTYHIDQATDTLRSLTTTDRIDELRFSASGPKFKGLFDGSEQLLTVTSIPYYAREITVP